MTRHRPNRQTEPATPSTLFFCRQHLLLGLQGYDICYCDLLFFQKILSNIQLLCSIREKNDFGLPDCEMSQLFSFLF